MQGHCNTWHGTRCADVHSIPHNNYEWFNENSDEIESFLTDWLEENGFNESICVYFGRTCDSLLDLKEQLVWAYVEIKCANFLVDNNIDY